MDSYEMKKQDGLYTVSMELKVKRNNYRNQIIEFMDKFDGVDIESIE